ncbi:30S ribosomal protein S7 [Candidatus Vidania fulgoroideae]|uniref:30S ribosomal protein S7 n=1 Tax=Candidatus Vidania fulgoroideorum TaxID=881286 RepID=A0A975AE77_9PROT|nr:30S ribosomal protein S7 [Candidatus Vidania fulgoroideae]
MSRKRKLNKKRILKYDQKYSSFLVSKFINIIMISGNKELSRYIVYKVLSLIKSRYKINPLIIFEKAIYNAKPSIELKKKKVGGSNYKIPVKITNDRGIYISISWIRYFAIKRKEKKFYISLFKEIIDTYNGNSGPISNKIELYKLADLNRAFAHFAF